MASKKKFGDTSFDFGANTSPKPKKAKTSKFGMKISPSGKVRFTGGKAGGGS